jgi:uncharacterized protein (TIGR02099 family)
MAGAPEVRFADVQIAMRKRRGRHHAALTARPPPELAGRIDVRADVAITHAGTRWHARGQVFAEALDTDLARLRAHLPVPDSLRSGVGSARVWASFSDDVVGEVVADIAMRDAKAQLAADALPLELASISGRATYASKPDGFTFATRGLRFRLPTGLEAQPGNFSIARTAPAGQVPRVEVRADGIDLKIAATLIDYFPVPRDIKTQAQRFAPRGRIADATLTWSGEDAAHGKAYTLKGRFEDLAVNAVDAWPGFAGLTGSIEGSEAGGTLVLASRNATLELSAVFRSPLAFDALDAQASWKRAGRALEVTIGEARFANADGEGRVSGTWRSLPDSKEKSPGYADFKGSLTRVEATRVANYLPNGAAGTRDWLERSVRAGTSTRVGFELKGDLWQFPFGADSDGHFLVEGDIHGGQLRYHPDWPSVDRIEGTFRFENRRMEIHADTAAIFASRASGVSAVVADLGAKPPLLTIDGDIDTTGSDGVRFLRESPLVNGPGAFTRAIAIDGPARLKLHLEYPFYGTDPVRVTGDYDFAGATANVGSGLALREMQGRLSFSERGVRATSITGTIFGQPARLGMSSQPDGQVLTTIEGRIDAAAMGNAVPQPLRERLQGGTQWQARILSGRQGTDVAISSDLKGLAVTLPEPLAKAADDVRPMKLAIARLGADDELVTVALAGGVYGRFGHTGAAGARRWNAALRFGAPLASEPAREGLWLYGTLPALDVDAWQSVFAAPVGTPAPASAPEAVPAAAAPVPPSPAASEGVELRGLDLTLATVRYMGHDFAQMHAQLQRTGGRWSGSLDSPKVAGEVHWDPAGKGRVEAKLDRLAIGEAAHTEAHEAQPSGGDLPALDVTAERFEFRGHWLGRLELKAEPSGEQWLIDKLDIVNGHAKLRSTGGWRRTGAGSITTLALKLDTENLNALLGQFGYGDYLKRGHGSLDASLVWPGYPYDFSLATLAGTLKVDARRGQFAKIEPGAGKLLALLSLQSLPRRALLDFRDVFSEGFAFDRIQGDVKVARGVLLTDNFEISGPSAFVSLAGEVSLPDETQSLTMRVVPEVSEGVALAASLIGTPVLGLSTLLVSKLLRNPLGKAVAYEYQVKGSWDNPQVTRLSGPPPKAAAASP